jgi:hypothetical protein
MDDIILTCKASIYNFTQLNWIRKPIDTKSEEFVFNGNITGFQINKKISHFVLIFPNLLFPFILNEDLIHESSVDNYSYTLSIRLKSAQINDSGIYICEAKSRDNNEIFEIDIEIDIQS